MKYRKWRTKISFYLGFNFTLLFSLSCMGIIGISKKGYLLNSYLFILPLILGIMVLIPLIVTLMYFIEDCKKYIEINTAKKEIIVTKRGRTRSFKVKDLKGCYYVFSRYEWNKSYDFYQDYKYIVFLLENRERIFITSLLADPKTLIEELNLNPTKVKTSIPYIDYNIGSGILTDKEYEKKVNEFYIKFSNKDKKELLEITKKPNVYSGYAIKAARKILDKK
jgi:hypothetical protein